MKFADMIIPGTPGNESAIQFLTESLEAKLKKYMSDEERKD